MENVFLNQKIETLRRDGYTTHANPVFARELMAALPRPEFNAVKCIDGTGRFAVEGYIYLPRAHRTIVAMIKRDIEEAERCVTSYRSALATLAA